MTKYDKNRLTTRIINLEKKFVEEKILCEAFPDRDKSKMESLIIEINELKNNLNK